MKKATKFRLALLLVLTLLLTPLTPLSARAAKTAQPDSSDYMEELCALVADTWEDGFFSSAVLTVGESEMLVDGQPVEISGEAACAPAFQDGEIQIPEEAVGKLADLPPSFRASELDGRASAQDAGDMLSLAEVNELGLEAELGPEGDTVALSAPFQTARLIVQIGGDRIPTYGAATVLYAPGDRMILQFDTWEEARDAYEMLSKEPGVRYCEPDCIRAVCDYQSWGTTRVGADRYIDYLDGQSALYPVTVAVLDTGMDTSHPFFTGRVADEKWDFDGNDGVPEDVHGHGSHVASIVVDETPGNVKIMPVKVLSDKGEGADSLVIEGIRWAAEHGANVINMSLGGPGYSAAYEDAINEAAAQGVTVVVAAGNEYSNVASFCPANVPAAITVGATMQDNTRAAFSNVGEFVDLTAPGVSVQGVKSGGGYTLKSGTSMAAPCVAGVAALLLSTDSLLTPGDIDRVLKETAEDKGTSGWDPYFGAGIVSAKNCIPDAATAVNGLILSPNEQVLRVGRTIGATATVNPLDAVGRTVVWQSADPAVATVDQSGRVTACGAGETDITVQTEDGLHRAVFRAKVPAVPVMGNSLNYSNISIYGETSFALTANVSPGNATYKEVLWSSGNSAIAQVDQDGVVKGRHPGKAVITATTVDGGLTVNCIVTVLAVPVTGISLPVAEKTVPVGSRLFLEPVITPKTAANQNVRWSSSDTDVAKVGEYGDVEFVAAGIVRITATTADGGKTAVCTITVNDPVTGRVFTGISCADSHGVAMRSDGTVWSWGANAYGALGDGTNTPREGMVQVKLSGGAPLRGVKKAVAVHDRSFVLREDGTVWGWGCNCSQSGEGSLLGDGTSTDRYYPVQMLSGAETLFTGVRDIVAGGQFLLLIKQDNSIWAVGENSRGQLGDGTTTARRYPVRVMSSASAPLSYADVSDMKAGERHTLIQKKDGTVWGFGDNSQGQLTGTPAYSAYPVRIQNSAGVNLGSVSRIFTGAGSCFAEKADGSVWGWGQNSGALGNGSTQRQERYPVRMMQNATEAMSGVSELIVQEKSTVIHKTDGTLYGTGGNLCGQLSDGSVNDRLYPVRMMENGTDALKQVRQVIQTGGRYSLFVKEGGLGQVFGVGYNGDSAGARLLDGSYLDRDYPVPSFADASGYLYLSAADIPVTGITMREDAAIYTDETLTLTPDIVPIYATDTRLSWSTSDSSIATAEDGVVKPKAAGEVIVTAAARDGRAAAVCTVRVLQRVFVQSLRMQPADSLPLNTGEHVQLSVDITPAAPTNGNINWSSSDTKVARVTDAGLVEALAGGTAVITAEAADGSGVKATCTIRVYDAPDRILDISVTPASVTIKEGQTFTLTSVSRSETMCTKSAVWSSSEQAVATVSPAGTYGAQGVVTAKSPGTAVVAVKTWNEKTAVCVVTVEEMPDKILSLSVTPASLTLTEGQTYTLDSMYQCAVVCTKSMTWSSSDPMVADVSATGSYAAQSVVTAKKPGSAVITVKSWDGKTAACRVKVKAQEKYVTLRIGYTKAIQNGIRTTIDSTGSKPFTQSGKTMLPIRFVSEKLGAKVKYVNDKTPIKIMYGNIMAELTLGQRTMRVTAGQTIRVITIDVPAMKKGGRTYVPLRAVSQALGFDVYYDAPTKIIVVAMPKATTAVRAARINEGKSYIK